MTKVHEQNRMAEFLEDPDKCVAKMHEDIQNDEKDQTSNTDLSIALDKTNVALNIPNIEEQDQCATPNFVIPDKTLLTHDGPN